MERSYYSFRIVRGKMDTLDITIQTCIDRISSINHQLEKHFNQKVTDEILNEQNLFGVSY